MVWSEHDNRFKQLNSQLMRECEAADWVSRPGALAPDVTHCVFIWALRRLFSMQYAAPSMSAAAPACTTIQYIIVSLLAHDILIGTGGHTSALRCVRPCRARDDE